LDSVSAQTADLSALSGLAPELAATFASIAGDIALVIDAHGVIRNVAVGAAALNTPTEQWVGRAWTDTVTGETRRKIEQMLQEVNTSGVSRRREVNHPGQSGPDIPVAYAAVRLGEQGPVLAVGRDLRGIAAIQQRFVESQQELERDYWKRRQVDARYRQLFQVATDAVMVVDALTLAIVEANLASARLLAVPAQSLVGQPATMGLDAHSRAAVEALLATTRATGHAAEIRARLAGSNTAIDVSATPFRSENTLLLLVRARAVEDQSASSDAAARLAEFVEHTPDAVAITDSNGHVTIANPAFLALCEAGSESLVTGRSLANWLGRGTRDAAALLAEVRRHGIAPQIAASFRGSQGHSVDVEISAALLTEGDQECVGFTIRRVAQRAAAGARIATELAQAIDALVAQVGRVGLPELMQAASRLTERYLVRSALESSGHNHVAAAHRLGISVATLEEKLHLLDLPDAAGPPTLLN
jgi:transcriptional regulator PpsR